MNLHNLFENQDQNGFRIGDPVIITGNVEFKGKTGDVQDIGRDGAFVVVDLYNYGPHSFQASDVSYNDYADSDDEQEYQQGVAEGNDHSLKKVWDRYSKHLMAARGDHPSVAQINKSGAIVRNIRKYVKDHHGQKALDDMERYAEKQQWNEGVAEGILGDREHRRVMPFVKRIAGEVSDYDRDEFGEELWSLLDQKYGSKFAQSVLADLDIYWDTYTELTGRGLDEASVYKKDQDLSSVSTQELEAFVKKNWGGGIPTYGQGQSVKRAMRELRRRQKSGVSEASDISGLIAAASMVQDYIVTAEVDGQTKRFRVRGMTGPTAARERFLKHASQARVIDVKPAAEKNVAEDAVADFLARGGAIQTGKYHRPRKSEKTDYGSRHIGGQRDAVAGKAGKTLGRAAATAFKGSGKPIVGEKAETNNEQPWVDPKLKRKMDYAFGHYAGYKDKPEAFFKWVMNSLEHSEENDQQHDRRFDRIEREIDQLSQRLKQVNEQHGAAVADRFSQQLAERFAADRPTADPARQLFAESRSQKRAAIREIFARQG